MRFIPFPPELAARSSENARKSNESRKGKSPGSHSTSGLACYREADGTLHMAHDPYEPQYPENAVPGLGTIHSRLEYYPNDTRGYTHTVSGFEPAETLLTNSAPWANPCFAVREPDGPPPVSGPLIVDLSEMFTAPFIMAPSETILAEMISENGGLYSRPQVIPLGMDGESAPEAVVYQYGKWKNYAFVGASTEIVEALVERYNIKGFSCPESEIPESQARLHEICQSVEKKFEKAALIDSISVLPIEDIQIASIPEPEMPEP